jgi:hypothetical protein
MNQSSQLPIYNSVFFLLKDLHQRVPKFSKLYKYSLGEKMLNTTMEMLMTITKANSQKDMKERVILIEILLEKTDQMLIHVRIAEELKLFNSQNAYPFLTQKIIDISRQSAGWKNIYIPQNLQSVRL